MAKASTAATQGFSMPVPWTSSGSRRCHDASFFDCLVRRTCCRRVLICSSGQGNLPGLAFRQLAALQATVLQPIKYRLRRDAERGGGALDRVAAIRPAWWVRGVSIELYRPDAPLLAQQVHGFMLERHAARRHDALGVQDGGNLLVHLSRRVELPDPTFQHIQVGAIRIRPHLAL